MEEDRDFAYLFKHKYVSLCEYIHIAKLYHLTYHYEKLHHSLHLLSIHINNSVKLQ